jgi:hypothetical protein
MVLRRLRASGVLVGWRGKQVAEGLFVASAYAPPQLVQVAEPDVLGIVDDDGVGVGDVQAAFHNVGADQNIVLAVDELEHALFQHMALQLPVRHPDVHIRA